MRYSEYEPVAALQPYVKCLWTLEGNNTSAGREKIFPDGCMEFIFNFGTPYRRWIGDEFYIQPKTFLVGQIKKYIELEAQGPLNVLGLRFHPWGFYAFYGKDISAFAEHEIAPEALWGSAGIALEKSIYSRPQNATETAQQFLLAQLKPNPGLSPVINAVNTLLHTHGNREVAFLADAAHLSLRQFNRRFTKITGLSPKHFAKIIRFQHFFAGLKLNPGKALLELALACGYYDQAHFNREFKEFTGFTPTTYITESPELANIFIR